MTPLIPRINITRISNQENQSPNQIISPEDRKIQSLVRDCIQICNRQDKAWLSNDKNIELLVAVKLKGAGLSFSEKTISAMVAQLSNHYKK
jgi:hypothetical protein